MTDSRDRMTTNILTARVSSCLLAFVLAAPAIAEPDLSGTWVLNGRAMERELVMTDAAREIQAAYDLLTDDPSLECEPASVSRVWANPNSRIRIQQSATEVRIEYELFDLRRGIPLGDETALTDAPSTSNLDGRAFSKMGSSYARYDGDRLVVETRRYTPGYIRTSRGVPQSAHTVTTEEFWRDGDELHLTLTHVDETLFEKPFVIDHVFRSLGDKDILPYHCEDAGYDWFEKLNQPGEGERR